MREGALFATMFGLGAGAVLVGVTVSRLVVGQAPERPTIVEPPPSAVISPVVEPPVVVPSATEPARPAVRRQHRAVVRKHRRPPVQEDTPLATASVPTDEAEPAAPSPALDDQSIDIIRGGAARAVPGSRAPGPRIIQIDPHDGAH
jgi:hypothetical protein